METIGPNTAVMDRGFVFWEDVCIFIFFVLLLDATKAFDKVTFKVIFDSLLKKKYGTRLCSYYIICILTNYVMLSGEVRIPFSDFKGGITRRD